jgi:hypothetical protein
MELPLQNVLFILSRKYMERGLKATLKILSEYLYTYSKILASLMLDGRTEIPHLTKCRVFQNFIFFDSYDILVLHKKCAEI